MPISTTQILYFRFDNLISTYTTILDHQYACSYGYVIFTSPFPCHLQVLYCKYHVEPMTQLSQLYFWVYLLKPNDYQSLQRHQIHITSVAFRLSLKPRNFPTRKVRRVKRLRTWLVISRSVSILCSDTTYGRHHLWRLKMAVSEARKEEANHVWRTAYDYKRLPPSNAGYKIC